MSFLSTLSLSLILFSISTGALFGQKNIYSHLQKDSVDFITNDTSVYMFGHNKKGSSGKRERLVVTNNHRYKLTVVETDDMGEVLQLQDSTGATAGNLLLKGKERHNIVMRNGEKFFWYNRHNHWAYQKNSVDVIGGDIKAKYATYFTLKTDINKTNVNAEVVWIFFAYRTLYITEPRNVKDLITATTILRILTLLH